MKAYSVLARVLRCSWNRPLAAICLGCAFSSPAAAADAVISGRVRNDATGKTLEGARIELRGIGHATVTDSAGEFRLAGVPPGPATLEISYTGLDTAIVPVDATESKYQEIRLTAAVYKLSPFVVSGEREGSAEAITLQKQSNGIRTIASTDAFGNLGGTPVELLMRLPGVEGESVGGDLRYARIRGMNQALSTVTIDGDRVPDGGNPNGREVQFQKLSVDTVARMEVIKSPTPDMAADSIGGAINMVSKSGFDQPERRIGISIGGIWRPADERDFINHNHSFSYSEVFKDRLGVAVNWGYRTTNSVYERTSLNYVPLPNGVVGPTPVSNFQFFDGVNLRTRQGGGVRLDYKLSPQSRFFFSANSNWATEDGASNNASFSAPQTVATRDAAGNPTGTGVILPEYTERVTEWRPLPTTSLTTNAVGHLAYSKTEHFKFAGIHRVEDLDIDYDVYFSENTNRNHGTRIATFTARGIGLRIEEGDTNYLPRITQTGGPDMTDIAAFTENAYDISGAKNEDRYIGTSFDIKKKLQTTVPTYVKGGFRYRKQERDIRNEPYRASYVGPDGVAGVNPATGVNDDNLAQFAHPQVRNLLFDGRYPKLPYPVYPGKEDPDSAFGGSGGGYSGYNINTALLATPQYFREDVAFTTMSRLVGKQSFEESISAAYLLGNIELGKLTILGGLRVEQTDVDGEGAKSGITPEERARRAAWVGTVTDAELRRRAETEHSERQNLSGKYRNVFPGLHFKYEPIRGLVTRLSYATNIGRPAIGQLIPRTTIDYENQTIATSNPSLKPQYADNFDLSAEYYFEPVGMFSVGLFLKEIKQFIYTAGGEIVGSGSDNGFEGQYAGYTLTTQRNGGAAHIRGIEVAYQQQFTFLPGFWNGFGVFANLTRMQAKGNYGTGNALGSLQPTSEIAGFNPTVANLGLSYIKNRATVRIQYNYRSRYLWVYSANQSSLRYFKARPVVDVRTQYTLSKHFDVYLDVVNIFSEPDRATEYFGGRPNEYYIFKPQCFFGINTRF